MKTSTALKWAYKQILKHDKGCQCDDCRAAHGTIETVIRWLKQGGG